MLESCIVFPRWSCSPPTHRACCALQSVERAAFGFLARLVGVSLLEEERQNRTYPYGTCIPEAILGNTAACAHTHLSSSGDRALGGWSDGSTLALGGGIQRTSLRVGLYFCAFLATVGWRWNEQPSPSFWQRLLRPSMLRICCSTDSIAAA